ncbi:hypothetical protein MJK70_25435 [Klebsiella pneumoniae]|nr:hypothetical protein MJK70_25435 [Klebsiella pneumoniae]
MSSYGSDSATTACRAYWRFFFVKQLGFSQEQAFVTFGAFAALVYGLISIGGYVGDHLLGTKRTIVLGKKKKKKKKKKKTPLCWHDWLLHDRHVATLKPDLIFIAHRGLSL